MTAVATRGAPSGAAGALARRRTKASVLLGAFAAVLYAWAKRNYPKSQFPWLVKRFLGWLLVRVIPFPFPRVVSGAGTSASIGKILGEMKCKKPLVITDEVIVQHGLTKGCTDNLTAGYELFDKVVPNPPVQLVDDCYDLYKKAGCDSIVAFGGGSPMDVAKVVGAKVVNPKPVESYKGFLKVLWPLPPLIAVPTTAGTGSETTVCSVLTVPEKKEKIVVADLTLVPKVAVLDPKLLAKLPKQITAATGMDALTHSIESYLAAWASPFTRRQSLSAAAKIFKYLEASYKDGANEAAREAMLNASFEAGTAFTRASVGYVHAIAHQLGGLYGTPHGDANAMILPHVLEWYITGDDTSDVCLERMRDLAEAAGLLQGQATTERSQKLEAAQKLVSRISQMNKEMKIPKEVAAIKAEDVPEITRRALAEAHGTNYSALSAPLSYWLDLGYPVPKYMTVEECSSIVARFAPAEEKKKLSA